MDDYTVKCWGANYVGQLGLGDDQHRGLKPSQMGDQLKAVDLGKQKVLQISANGDHTCAVLDNHRVKCWGGNQFGKLGFGEKSATRGTDTKHMGDQLPAINLGKGKNDVPPIFWTMN